MIDDRSLNDIPCFLLPDRSSAPSFGTPIDSAVIATRSTSSGRRLGAGVKLAFPPSSLPLSLPFSLPLPFLSVLPEVCCLLPSESLPSSLDSEELPDDDKPLSSPKRRASNSS